MDQLYLSRIRLSQFRSFENLEISLEPSPGVLIVHGSNGLGKSSLFDGLEWALTDEIDHFRKVKGVDKVGNYLCRWRKGDPGPTIASMTFSDGEDITRSLSSSRAHKSKLDGSIRQVTDYLKSPAWAQPISALNRYLLLTHFLGQSTVSRLTHRSADERFDILKEAAQSSEVEAIADRLHGKGNTTPVRAFARQADAAEKEARSLRNLLGQEAQLFEATQVSGALDDSEGLRLARQIADILALLLPEPQRPSLGQSLDPLIVDTLQSALDDAQEAARQRQARIDRALQLVTEDRNHAELLASANGSLKELDQQLTSLLSDAANAQSQVSTRNELVETRRAEFAAARSRHEQLLELRSQRRQASALEADQTAARTLNETAEQAYSIAERALANAVRRQDIVDRLTVDIGVVDSELVALRQTSQLVDQAIISAEQERQLRQNADALSSINADIEARAAAAAREVQSAEAEETRHAKLVEDLEQTVSTLSGAIATIATNLPDEASDCPVCATHFHEPGVLHLRAAEAAGRLAPVLLAQQQALGAASERRESAAAHYASLAAIQAQMRSFRDRIAAESEANKARLELIASRAPFIASGDLTAARKAVDAAISELLRRRARRIHWRDRLGTVGGLSLSELLSQEKRRLDDARRSRDASQNALAELSTAIENAQALISLLMRPVFDTDRLDDGTVAKAIDDAEKALAQAKTRLDDAASEAQAADAQLAALRTSIASAEARKAQFDETRTTALAAQERVQEQWVGLGFAGIILGDASVATFAADAAKLVARGREAEDLLRRLRDGREAWVRQQSYRATYEELRSIMDGPLHGNREELRAVAGRRADERQQLADRTEAAREIARAATADVYSELEQFNSAYILPLDVLTKTINRAILCDPRVGIDLHVRARKIEQSAIKAAEIPEGVGEIDPALVHSEGQMAALAVSILCAASLTFPWSRWRALVLDDPLQHNDTIHAAAFADMVGNLVHEKGYQVLLSTHDLSQAQFLQRKFDARHVPCAALQLLGEGRKGVDTAFRPARGTPQLAEAG